jgi:glycine/D-amino acid oxidase-like deaminating enzyme
MRTDPLPGGPDVSLAGPRFGFRRREDNGYIVSQADATISDIVPDSFRLFRRFLPILKSSAKGLRIRIGSRFVEEWRLPRNWALDQVTPFEQARVLAPGPSRPVLDEAAEELVHAYPFFRDMKIAGRWGGFIDVTPDALPIISAVDAVPGLYLATGLSGHGFGIGPGAGRLACDLITGDSPVVDASPFRFQRFAAPAA